MDFLKLSLFLAFALLQSAVSFCDLEFAEIRTLKGGRASEEIEELRFGTFNVLNLEFSPGKYHTNPETGRREFVLGKITKDKEQTQGVARAIKEEKLDFVVLQEVEGMASLQKFNEQYLDDAYEVFLQKGNDGRGIEIGFLVKKDLPFKIRMHGHARQTWENPKTGNVEPLFSRDLPSLHVRLKTTSMNDPPEFILAGTHYKSQRDRSGDPRSAFFRSRQAEETKKILKEYEKLYPETPIFMGGDFNADIHKSPEFKGFFEDRFMQDSFDLGKGPITPSERVTHTYHPREGPTENSQLDAILANQAGADSVLDARVHRYKNADGSPRPLPKTYEEREANPSDHFMVVMRARFGDLADIK